MRSFHNWKKPALSLLLTLAVLANPGCSSNQPHGSALPGFLAPLFSPLFSWKPTRQLLSYLSSGSVPQSYFSGLNDPATIVSNPLKTYDGTLQLPIDLENYAFQFARRSPAAVRTDSPKPTPSESPTNQEVTLILKFEDKTLKIPFSCSPHPGATESRSGRDFTLFRAKKVLFQWIPNPIARKKETCEILSFGFVPLAPHYASTGEARANQPPEGEVQKMDDQGVITGWAVDRDTPDRSLFIHFYIDGEVKTRSGQYFGELQTHRSRPDLNAQFKTLAPHGFQYEIPKKYWDGKRHDIWVYALDSDTGSQHALNKSVLRFEKPSLREPKF